MPLSFVEKSFLVADTPPFLSSGFDPLSRGEVVENMDGRYLAKILMACLVDSLIRACSMSPVMCGQICLHLQVD